MRKQHKYGINDTMAPGKNAGTYQVKAEGEATDNYLKWESEPQTFTIAKKPLTIKADDKTITQPDGTVIAPDSTYYAGLHAYNRTSADGKKVFSPWSNVRKIKVK